MIETHSPGSEGAWEWVLRLGAGAGSVPGCVVAAGRGAWVDAGWPGVGSVAFGTVVGPVDVAAAPFRRTGREAASAPDGACAGVGPAPRAGAAPTPPTC
jgi:hypothetical protein